MRPSTFSRYRRPPHRGAWIEIFWQLFFCIPPVCRPPHRGAWIEIPLCAYQGSFCRVAPRTGGRGLKSARIVCKPMHGVVAPRTGGRGLKYTASDLKQLQSRRPPHRGAWIEIRDHTSLIAIPSVAPRTGGRGLKSIRGSTNYLTRWSPPAQGGVD